LHSICRHFALISVRLYEWTICHVYGRRPESGSRID
jgi:hypothetical protein